MTSSDRELLHRAAELAQRSYDRGIYTNTSFLTEAEQALLATAALPIKPSFVGGREGAERAIAVFGSPEELGYEAELPLTYLEIAPKSQKFSEELTHRDHLGSCLALGIKRETLGDLILSDGKAYLVCLDLVGEYLMQHLERVRHTAVVVSVLDALPPAAAPRFEEKSIVAASDRLDAVVSAVWNLSRSQGKELVEKERVSIGGKLVTDPAASLNAGDRVSVRGYGKFYFDGIIGTTRSERSRISIRLFC